MDAADQKRKLAELGRQLAVCRKALGLSQTQLAKRIGLLSAESVSGYERGQVDPRYTTLVKIADGLCLPTSALMVGETAPPYAGPEQRAHQLIALLKESNPDALETAIASLEGIVLNT
jgi:transcriptional regulator with XRE-family HTH domain